MAAMIPFPPYDKLAVIQRFPDDIVAQERIVLLHQVIEKHQNRAVLSAQHGVSQARISQLVHSWQEQGVQALLARPRQRRACPPNKPILRRFMKGVAATTPFEAARSSTGSSWACHIADPAERGQWLVAQLRQAVHSVDMQLETKYKVARLLERHLLHNEELLALVPTYALSRSRLYAILDHGLDLVHARLAQQDGCCGHVWPWRTHLLDHTVVAGNDDLQAIHQALTTERAARLVGPAETGKSTLAALVAQAWHRMGWNVYWIRSECSAFALEHSLQQLHAIGGWYGVIQHTQSDPAQPLPTRVTQIKQVLAALPSLLIIDDAHVCHKSTGWHKTVVQLYRTVPTLRVLLVGRACDIEIGKQQHAGKLPWKPLLAAQQYY